jgi:fatty-acyl-CoA synthase
LTQEDGSEPTHEAIRSWTSLLHKGDYVEDRADRRDLLQIIYTSGTESRPKGAMLTHEAVMLEYQSVIFDGGWSAELVGLHALPLFHCAQLDASLGPALQVGATNIITATPTPENLIPLITRYRVTSFFAPPTLWISILRSPLLETHDLSHLERGYYGASIMPTEVLHEIRKRWPNMPLWNFYGQTEIAPAATVLHPVEHEAHLGSAGRAVFNVQTRVVDEAMNDVAPGEVGEVVHRSAQLMIGYWNDPVRTAEAFAGGWFHSGDLATIDADGYITIVDRKKDMINSGGENVASREVEEVIYTHPAVSEAAVVGLPHPLWIEAVTAFVVLRSGSACSEAELRQFCQQRLAGFKTPKAFHFVETLPKNASGKILKRDLRHLELIRTSP